MPDPPESKGVAQEVVRIKGAAQGVDVPRLLGVIACMPMALFTLLVILIIDFVRRPLKFFSRSPHAVQLPPCLDGVVHEDLDVGRGIRLHAVSFGRQRDKPLMLFLHGFPECWFSWRDQLVHFRTQYEVVAVDMRGFNTSSKPQAVSAYSLEHLTADVAGVVRCLGRTSCTLVAHDWGGAVAWAVAGRYPGLVERLAVLAGPHWYLYGRNLTAEQMLRSSYFLWFQLPLLPELLLLNTDSALIDEIWRGGHAHSVRRRGAVSAADVEIYKAAVQQPGAATGSLNYYRAAMLTNLGLLPMHPEVDRAFSRVLDIPVLVVWGASDIALGLSINRDIGMVAPRAAVHVLPDCSHWIQADQPEELRRVMDEWLAANPLPLPPGPGSGFGSGSGPSSS